MSEWSPDQDRALVAINRWMKSADQVFVLEGPAGTGKTTIAAEVAQSVGSGVIGMAFTGKAASVLRERGFPNAATAHSQIYKPADKSTKRLKDLENELAEAVAAGAAVDVVNNLHAMIAEERRQVNRPSFAPNPESPIKHARLVVLDESSTIDDKLGSDLLSFGTKVLVLGDRFQLPPVRRGEGYFTAREPDATLTEIHRQARGNPIIELSRIIREERRRPDFGTYGDKVRIVRKGTIDPESVAEFDQFICGRNATRRKLNEWQRRRAGFTARFPMVGDRLVCLRNNHDTGLLNGVIFRATTESLANDDEETVFFDVESEDGGIAMTVEAWQKPLLGGDLDHLFWTDRKAHDEFDYGYALTCHKAQGSQWRRVVVNDEGWCFREHRWRWLYTAITRAREELVVSAD